MIIAKVGAAIYVLNSFDQAEKILKIFSEAKQVDDFFDENYVTRFRKTERSVIEISIVPDQEIVTDAEATEMIKKRQDAQALANAQALAKKNS